MRPKDSQQPTAHSVTASGGRVPVANSRGGRKPASDLIEATEGYLPSVLMMMLRTTESSLSPSDALTLMCAITSSKSGAVKVAFRLVDELNAPTSVDHV